VRVQAVPKGAPEWSPLEREKKCSAAKKRQHFGGHVSVIVKERSK